MDLARDLQRIAMQEERLALARFDASAAWALGSRLKAMAEARSTALAIEVRLARRTVFFHAMAGSRPLTAGRSCLALRPRRPSTSEIWC